MTTMTDNVQKIFTDQPDGLGEEDFYFGTFVPAMGSMENVEVARAFSEAGDRLIEAAAARGESWEAAYPILYCYRHSLEMHLKASLPEGARGHRLMDLFLLLKPYLDGRYPANEVAWLAQRVDEFDRLDPRSTVFRYPDAAGSSYHPGQRPDSELWVDFRRMQQEVMKLFRALEWVRLHRLQSGEI